MKQKPDYKKEKTDMDQRLKEKIGLFAANRMVISKEFALDMEISHMASALLFALQDKEADTERLKEVKKILKSKTSVLSAFRESSEPMVVAGMALSSNPEQYLDDLIWIFNIVKKKHALEENYALLSSMIILDSGRKAGTETIKEKTDAIMKAMSKEHPILTSSEDLPFATLLAMTDRSVDAIISDMEECYTYAKKELKIKADADSIQAIAQIFALSGGNIRSRCDKIADLFDSFKAHKAKFDGGLLFPALASLVDIDMGTDALVEEIIEAADLLKTNKGFGNFSLENKDRLMFAAVLASEVFKADTGVFGSNVNQAIMTNSVISMIIAEEVCMMCVMFMMMSSANNN